MHLSDSTNAIIGTSVAQQAEKCVQYGLLCFTPTLHTYSRCIYIYIYLKNKKTYHLKRVYERNFFMLSVGGTQAMLQKYVQFILKYSHLCININKYKHMYTIVYIHHILGEM